MVLPRRSGRKECCLSSFSLWEKARMRGDAEFSFLILILSLALTLSLTLTLSQRERELKPERSLFQV
jgi:hypothetical protein